ncbi:unnamed protein product [Schistosoma mattheei]|uniref:Uncharacterized protein n=1 Tax=Schistosoma mattheei TaxID=31246 RepID=A0AA85AW29_9TREM|nr:unnamed protein product [Schistosoma mattheei]
MLIFFRKHNTINGFKEDEKKADCTFLWNNFVLSLSLFCFIDGDFSSLVDKLYKMKIENNLFIVPPPKKNNTNNNSTYNHNNNTWSPFVLQCEFT